ncbi:MAG: superoxide dismutase [Candidatus Micrarchaeota archaeon]|nr:superoxide dismutase [Candidatus Micrarchaeota archaeon]MCX8154453.1 superoxide dismutase [Candidatus Micrarchaeota archaeon]
MRVSLPDLPYDYNALEPVISREIMELHHKKHHQSYVDGANRALEKLERYRKGEVDIDVRAVLRDLSFHLNGHELHSLFWNIMRPPRENNSPDGKINTLILSEYPSVQAFQREFSETAKSVEGSGWAVAILYNRSIQILTVEKHNLMHVANSKVILAIDVWEHAYYLQYRNNRSLYVDNWWKLVNWDYVNRSI